MSAFEERMNEILAAEYERRGQLREATILRQCANLRDAAVCQALRTAYEEGRRDAEYDAKEGNL